ncbi:LysR family transcriptional regulator, hydrogen peroxide-inducible genes activator [Neorhodopirellula lusitana]|uniref:LysR family transcriptional regulator, hydrogen peroxide-inducible genes activator n=1 Tax=Neorhodopirellula lusitana TaxID=445327 RepID=A0ABY1PS34_9BACT|nr:LysR family transcriptional regulator [Neorhodopirellula lusitana]SMP44450.1 LysR family transcriptional regulator, hydrogen peroxide-inducible genes activator [Neorhodopirellula lusitana]
MDMEQLANFQCLADLKNFTHAAERLNISQPALSRSIQRLEEELGQPLFDRKPRVVELTDAGLLFQSRSQQILMIVEDTKAEISDDGQSGRIRIGAIPTIAPFFLPDLLRQFSDAFPDASLIVQEDTTDHLMKRCKQGELDVAILALPVSSRYVEVEELFDEELVLVMPLQHPLSKKKQIRIADIEQYPFVLLGEAHCLTDNITSFCRQRSIQPVAVERTSQLMMVQELVTLGHGVSMIPEMAKKLDRSSRRTYRSISGTKPKRTIAAVWNPYRFQSRLLREFGQHLRDYAESFGK